jgi:hypothetical protein
MGYSDPEAIRKYEMKTYWVRLYTMLQPRMDEAHRRSLEGQAVSNYVIEQVKPILDQKPMVLEMRVAYYAYAQALYRSQRKFTYRVDRIREHQILRHRFESRGLDPSILDEIDKRLIIDKAGS